MVLLGDPLNHLDRSRSQFLGLAVGIFVNLILFEADLAKWWRERNIVRDGYEQIDEDGDGKLDGVGSYAAAPAAAPVIHARAITHPLQLPCVTWTLLLPHSTTTSAEQ